MPKLHTVMPQKIKQRYKNSKVFMPHISLYEMLQSGTPINAVLISSPGFLKGSDPKTDEPAIHYIVANWD